MFYLQPVVAEDTFQVAILNNGNYEILYEDNLNNAKIYYAEHIDEYDNLLLLQNNYVINMEYGIVSIDSDDNCSVNVEYLSVNTNSAGYVNGCYGKDAAYIKSSDDLKEVDFIISGDYGRGSINDLTLIPLEKIINVSNYTVNDQILFHNVKSDLSSTTYASKINLGQAPSYLENDVEYYSYDGHYFYQNLEQLLIDYQNKNFKNSINYNNPYYNYYMYLSHRSLSNYTVLDLENYFENYLLIDNKLQNFKSNYSSSISDVYNQSQLYQELTPFIVSQYLYGSNSMLMLSLSINETASGRSSLSFRRNNLFGHAAYDSSVEASAKRYSTLFNSILSHAKNYISASYLNPEKFQYHGGFLGNKESGMNVSYASDPYWGEKAASYYSQIDAVLNYQDLNKYMIGISNDYETVKILDSNFDTLYTNSFNNSAYLILGELDDYYLVQNELTTDTENYTYDFNNVAYVLKSQIDVLIGNSNYNANDDLITYTYDANGGYYFDGSSTLALTTEATEQALELIPSKEGYIFNGYQQTPTSFVASYLPLEKIAVIQTAEEIYSLNDKLNFNNYYLQISTDTTTFQVPLDSNYVDKVELDALGTNLINVDYYGNQTSFTVEVTEEKDEVFASLDEYFTNLTTLENLSETEYLELLNKIEIANQYQYTNLSNETFRKIDNYLILKHTNANYILNNNGYDVSLSGVAIDTMTEQKNFLINDNVTVTINDSDDQELLKLVTNNQYSASNQFAISIKYNQTDVSLNNYLLVSVLKPDDDNNQQYYVFVKNDNGEIIRLATQQSADYITFKTKYVGDYIVASKENEAKIVTLTTENLNVDTSQENSFVILYHFILKIIIALIVLIIILLIIKKVRKKYASNISN